MRNDKRTSPAAHLLLGSLAVGCRATGEAVGITHQAQDGTHT